MQKAVLKIDGMACGMCEAHINDVVRKTVPGAQKVTSSHKKGETSFIAEGEIDLEALRAAIDKTGYVYRSGEVVPYVKRGLFGG